MTTKTPRAYINSNCCSPPFFHLLSIRTSRNLQTLITMKQILLPTQAITLTVKAFSKDPLGFRLTSLAPSSTDNGKRAIFCTWSGHTVQLNKPTAKGLRSTADNAAKKPMTLGHLQIGDQIRAKGRIKVVGFVDEEAGKKPALMMEMQIQKPWTLCERKPDDEKEESEEKEEERPPSESDDVGGSSFGKELVPKTNGGNHDDQAQSSANDLAPEKNLNLVSDGSDSHSGKKVDKPSTNSLFNDSTPLPPAKPNSATTMLKQATNAAAKCH